MDYRFKPISKTCAGTGEPLVPGSECYSALVDRNGVLERLDFSSTGWQGLPPNGIGYWKCTVPEPEQQHAAVTDPETLLSYFEQLLEAPNAQQERLAYVLALLLLQRRRLQLDSSVQRDQVEYLQLSGSRGEGPFEVRDQQLSQAEISQLQSLLNQQLLSEWNAA